MRRPLLALALSAAVLVGAAAPATARGDRPATIADLVARSGGTPDGNPWDFDLLLTAVGTAGLTGALQDPAAELTVFAPNDRAFVLLARDLGYGGWDEAGAWSFLVTALTGLGGGDPIPVLTNVLLYHVAPTQLDVFEVLFSRQVDTLAGVPIRVRLLMLRDQDPDLRDPRLVVFGLQQETGNGVVHTIDRVLLPVNV